MYNRETSIRKELKNHINLVDLKEDKLVDRRCDCVVFDEKILANQFRITS